jgi:L(+)-tartrate dehydratase beta subunit
MESFEREFIRQTGVKLIVGKGGMGPETVDGCRTHKAVHAVFPGGCAVLAATEVEDLFETNKARFDEKKGPIVREISSQVRFIK